MNRRRFFWGLAAATAALAIVAGSGTFGFFSSTTVNPGNSFFAGTLVIDNSRDATFILSASNMQPGDSLSRQVTLAYGASSSLDMNYSVSRTSIVLSDTIGNDGLNPSMCATLQISVTRVDDGQQLNDGAVIPAGQNIVSDTLAGFTFAGTWSLNNDLNGLDTYDFTVSFPNPPVSQDWLQGDGCIVEYTWSAVQQTSGPSGPNEDLVTQP